MNAISTHSRTVAEYLLLAVLTVLLALTSAYFAVSRFFASAKPPAGDRNARLGDRPRE